MGSSVSGWPKEDDWHGVWPCIVSSLENKYLIPVTLQIFFLLTTVGGMASTIIMERHLSGQGVSIATLVAYSLLMYPSIPNLC